MCLTISPKSLRKSNSRKVVYKALLQHPQTKELFSLYQYVDEQRSNCQYKLNELYISDRESNKITYTEDLECEIHYGTHVFLNKQEVINRYENANQRQRMYNGEFVYFNVVVVMCKVEQKNHVADGKFANAESAVYTKITPIEIIEMGIEAE